MIDHGNKIIIKEYLCNDLSIIGNNYTIIDCNLSQISAHSPICDGLSGLRFEGDCNLKNCDVPEGSFVSDSCSCFGFHKNEESMKYIIERIIDSRVQKAVDEMAECSFMYPDKSSAKLKARVDKQTTETLLSADGAPVIIEAPEGWKK